MRSMLLIALAGILAVAGCKAKDQAAGRTDTSGQGTMAGMPMDSMPMSGGGMGMGDSALMSMMRAHMDSMMRLSPGQMAGMMAAHDRMMSQMLDRMGADMRSMHMSADARWNALVDSVKADLADLPGLTGKELGSRMKAHEGRVRRLIAMHEGMMQGR
jgi:hypothetical protein